MISNNFPGESNSRNVYKWLKKNSPPFVLKTLSSIATPAAEALLENLFRSAVETEDVPVAKHLLRAGASPNGPMCRHLSLPDHVTPLQVALSRGNTKLAQELINAGPRIDEGGAGWKSSALVLAIIGNNIRGDERFWGSHGSSSDDGDEDNDYMDTWSLFETSSQDFAVSGTDNDPFFDLIQSLMNAGAAINPDGVGQTCSSVREWTEDWSPFLDGHSPLTAASKYRHKQLVDVFLQRGADVKFLTNRDSSALHECLYSWGEMSSDDRNWISPRSFFDRGQSRSFPGCGNLSNLVDVARSLISAGAAVNDESGFCFEPSPNESDFIYCTTLDLGVLTGSVELVDMMLGAGACTTTKVSLEHAIYNGCTETVTRLLNIGAPLSIEAIDGLVEGDESRVYAISLLRPNLRIKRAIFQQAIRLGATSTIEYILNGEIFNPQKLFYDMTEAFQQCCAEGHINTLRLLLSKSSAFKVSISPWFGQAIEVAIENCHDDILDILLSAGPDIDVKVNRESVLLAALRKKNMRIIRKLIRAGVRLSKRNEECAECKHIHESNDVFIAAINLGDYHVINSLIDAGASLHTLGTTDCMLGSKLCILPLTAAIVGKNLTLVCRCCDEQPASNCQCDSDTTISSDRKPRFGASQYTHPARVESIRFNSFDGSNK
jgi:ankyrin repeat protein